MTESHERRDCTLDYATEVQPSLRTRIVHGLKTFLIGLGVTALILGLLFLWGAWELGVFPNWGFESGYYGQFNRVQHVIEDMDGLEIVGFWQHDDLGIDEFGFVLLVDGHDEEVGIEFYDGLPEMNEWNKKRLRAFIEAEIDAMTQGE